MRQDIADVVNDSSYINGIRRLDHRLHYLHNCGGRLVIPVEESGKHAGAVCFFREGGSVCKPGNIVHQIPVFGECVHQRCHHRLEEVVSADGDNYGIRAGERRGDVRIFQGGQQFAGSPAVNSKVAVFLVGGRQLIREAVRGAAVVAGGVAVKSVAGGYGIPEYDQGVVLGCRRNTHQRSCGRCRQE